MKKTPLIIATRESPLALWQANWVKNALQQAHPELVVQLLGMTTQADRLLETPLIQMGGKGVFVKELEEALLDKRADIAVHSMKDVPMVLPEGLVLSVMCDREESRDVFVSNQYASFRDLPPQSVVGTSSLRRQSQLLALRPDLEMVGLRGNVSTRLAKLDRGDFSAIILAAAGLKRLGLASRISSYLSFSESLPAAGQGVLGIECRRDDMSVQALLAPLNDAKTFQCVTAERAMCLALGGGCQTPVAAFAEAMNGDIILRGLVATPDGKTLLQAERRGPISDAEKIGLSVAEDLLKQGAEEILNAL